jgi:hypothetical protein
MLVIARSPASVVVHVRALHEYPHTEVGHVDGYEPVREAALLTAHPFCCIEDTLCENSS